MNEFVVTINEKKISINFPDGNEALINEEVFIYNLTKLNGSTYKFTIKNKSYLISALKNGSSGYNITLNGQVIETKVLSALQEKAANLMEAKHPGHSATILKSPMPGMIIKIRKEAGEEIEQGDSLLILEAMKMENDIRAPVSGRIKEIKIKEGQAVEKGIPLLIIE